MAENNTKMEPLTFTTLYSKPFWNNTDSTKSKRFLVNLLNGGVQFTIESMGSDNKFTSGQKVSLTFMNFNDMALVNMVEEMINRMEDIIDHGKTIPKEGLCYHNNKSIKEATQKLEFNVFSPDDTARSKYSGYVKLSKKKDDGKFDDQIIWFGQAKNIFRSTESEKKPSRDYEAYTFLQDLSRIFKSIVARSSLSRDAHFKRYLDNSAKKDKNSTNNNNNNQKSNNYNNSSFDDDFDF